MSTPAAPRPFTVTVPVSDLSDKALSSHFSHSVSRAAEYTLLNDDFNREFWGHGRSVATRFARASQIETDFIALRSFADEVASRLDTGLPKEVTAMYCKNLAKTFTERVIGSVAVATPVAPIAAENVFDSQSPLIRETPHER